MKKINLDQPMLTIQGKPIKTPVLDDEGKPKIGKDKKPEVKNSTIRNYLLTLLGTRFQIIEQKEAFWTTELGIQIAEEQNKVLEISDDKFKFLKRLIGKNKHKIIQQTPTGQREVERELFFPFETGQLLKAFGEEEDEEK